MRVYTGSESQVRDTRPVKQPGRKATKKNKWKSEGINCEWVIFMRARVYREFLFKIYRKS